MNSATHRLVLAGAGHAHLVAIRRWIDSGYRPPEGTVLINPHSQAWYSGMMPGLIANRFSKEQCAVELAPLCRALGIELLIGEIAELDASQREIKLKDGKLLKYQYLSLNVGSKPPQPAHSDGSVELAPAKPFAQFTRCWETWQERNDVMNLSVLGAGAAAFELALALHKSLPRANISLICSSTLLSTYPIGLQKRATKILCQRGIRLVNNSRINSVSNGYLISEDGRQVQSANALVIATGAAALSWQARCGLACDQHGFVQVGPTLQSKSHPEVLASGDCASLPGAVHSGVYAVRQGASLFNIIPAWLEGKKSDEYKPQKRALALLATADGNALMSYGGISAGGRILGMYKDYLDKTFIRRHRLL